MASPRCRPRGAGEGADPAESAPHLRTTALNYCDNFASLARAPDGLKSVVTVRPVSTTGRTDCRVGACQCRAGSRNFGREASFATLLLYAFRSREEVHNEMRI